MNIYKIKPGISIGPIQIGMGANEVMELWGKPQSIHGNRWMYHDGFFIDYGEYNKVEFIEIGKSNKYSIVLDGHDLHKTNANKAIEIVSKFDDYDRNESDLGFGYVFKKIQISLWRGSIEMEFFEAIGQAAPRYF